MRSKQMADGSRLSAIVFTLAAIGGCETTPSATEADYGNSVRQMVQSQTLNAGPVDNAPVDTGDGVRAQNAIDVYREDVARPEQVNKDLTLGVDGGNR
jgi:hypothetical protein